MKSCCSRFLLSGLLLIIISLLNINFISADPACYVDTEANCNYNEGIVLIRISGSTNAHGALQSQSNFPSNLVVCCQEIGEGSYSCIDDDEDGEYENKIVGLSSAGNAHSERPEYNDYGSDVCYEFFENIIATTTNPGGDYIPILSLSSEENAHIGSPSAYSRVVYGIVGEGGGGGGECSLQDAYWEKAGERIDENNNYVLSGINVELVVEGTECDEETIDFTITEDSTSNPGGEILGETFLEGRADPTWEAQYMELTVPERRPPRYSFNGEVSGGGSRVSDLLLTVYDNSDLSVDICYDYTSYFGEGNPENEEICDADPYDVAPASASGVDCDAPGINCSCTWESDECISAWTTPDGTCFIENQEIENECDEEPVGTMTFSWEARWVGPLPVPLECEPDTKTVVCPAEIPLPFFGIYNFVAALLLIAAVYFVLSFRKLQKKK